eukprot:2883996-Pleurochrysis_carterae.AAC.1
MPKQAHRCDEEDRRIQEQTGTGTKKQMERGPTEGRSQNDLEVCRCESETRENGVARRRRRRVRKRF